MKLIMLLTLMGSASALFDRELLFCRDRNSGDGPAPRGCAFFDEGLCRDANGARYNFCDGELSLPECKSAAESIDSAIGFQYPGGDRSCEILFNAGTNTKGICPSEFGGGAGLSGSGPISKVVQSLKPTECYKCA